MHFLKRNDIIDYIVRKNGKLVIAILIFSLIALLFQLPMPLLSKYIFDSVIIPRKLNLLKKVIVLFGIYLFGRIISVYLKNKFMLIFKSNISKQLRELLYQHILFAKVDGLRKYQSGYLVERLHTDSEEVSRFLGNSLPALLENILTFLAGTILCWYISPHLALVTYIMLPFYAVSTKIWAKRVYTKQYTYRESRSSVHGITNSFLKNIMFLKSQANYESFIEKYKHVSDALFRAEKDVLHISLIASLTIQVIAFISPVIVIVYGAYEIIHSRLTIGGLIAFNSFMSYLFNPIKNFVNLMLLYQRGKASLDKMIELLMLVPEKNWNNKNFNVQPKDSSISIRNIKFSYSKNGNIFNDFSVNIPSGSIVIVKGKSGVGKSTLSLLMMRIYNVDSGQILIGDKNIKTIPLKTLRNTIGYVPQNPIFFPETIYDNLKISNPKASLEEMTEALNIACCDFLWKTKNGIYSQVQELAANFSGGELIRINLAMAILKKPRIIVLDESVSQVDQNTRKRLVMNVLSFAKRNKITTFWVTHGHFDDIAASEGFTKVLIEL